MSNNSKPFNKTWFYRAVALLLVTLVLAADGFTPLQAILWGIATQGLLTMELVVAQLERIMYSTDAIPNQIQEQSLESRESNKEVLQVLGLMAAKIDLLNSNLTELQLKDVKEVEQILKNLDEGKVKVETEKPVAKKSSKASKWNIPEL